MRRFWHITLPLLKPVLAVVMLFSTIFTFSDFNIVYVLTHGGPINSTHLFATLSRMIGIDTGRIGEGAAISLYLFPLLVFVVWAQLRFVRKQSPADGDRRAPAVRWGRSAKHLLLVPFLLFALFPFYHMTLTSLKQDRELYDRHAVPLIIKQGPTLEHYTKLLWDTEFLTWTKNSLLVTVLATRGVGRHRHHRGLRARPAEVRRGGRPRHRRSSSPTSCPRRSSSCRWPRSSTGSGWAIRSGRSC